MNGCRILIVFFLSMCLGGCEWMPGKPKPSEKWQPASETLDFITLYKQNCLACHGDGKTIAGSIAMNNPTYAALVPSNVLKKVISYGVPGTAMPGFSRAAGGTLTDAQINILVEGILSFKSLQGALPPYSAPLGESSHGDQVFSMACASCHGPNGSGGDRAGSVVDPDYLELVSDQYLRTIIIAGRPDLGCPDLSSRTPGNPLTSQDIADVTAWLASQRKNEFGQSIPSKVRSPQ